MHDVLRFWLDRGVDGFRMDVVHLIGKDPALPDEPDDSRRPRRCTTTRETHELLREIRRVLDGYPGDRAWSARSTSLDRPGWHRTTATATSCTWSSTSRCVHPWDAEAGATSSARRG